MTLSNAGCFVATMDQAQKIRAVRERMKLSQDAFAERLGVTRGAVGNWELGKGIGAKHIRAIAKIAAVSADWLMDDSDSSGDIDATHEMPAATSVVAEWAEQVPGSIPEIDVYGGMGGGGFVSEAMVMVGGNRFAADGVKSEWLLPPNFLEGDLRVRRAFAHIIEVRGDSMEPTLLTGDRVVIDTTHTRPSPDGIYAIEGPFGDVVVKRLKVIRGSDPLAVRVISDNPRNGDETIEIENLRVIGRVAGRFTRM